MPRTAGNVPRISPPSELNSEAADYLFEALWMVQKCITVELIGDDQTSITKVRKEVCRLEKGVQRYEGTSGRRMLQIPRHLGSGGPSTSQLYACLVQVRHDSEAIQLALGRPASGPPDRKVRLRMDSG